MTVRALTALDVEAMAQIHAASFDRPWPALDMAVHIEKDHCLGLGSPLTSFIILRGTDLHCEILTIATHPDHRGQGYGHQLLSSAVQILASEGKQELFLEVAEDNDVARGLYKSLGFVPIGRRPGYYKRKAGRMAAITYSLRL